MKIASLDLGSNTFLMLVADIEDGQVKKVYRDENEVVKLGSGIARTKRISDDSLERARLCFEKYRAILDHERVDHVIAVATSASRDAENREQFESLAASYGFKAQTISGELEAQVTFQGSTFDVDLSVPTAVIDVGGGSTEIIGFGENRQITGHSLDIGSVRLTDQFFPKQPPTFDQVQKLQQFATSQFLAAAAKFPQGPRQIVAVAGTPTSLACLERGQPYDESFVHLSRLNLEKLQSWILKLFPLPVSDREKIIGMPKGRADVLVAGTCILAAALQALKAKEIIVSTKGVRFGVALQWEHFV